MKILLPLLLLVFFSAPFPALCAQPDGPPLSLTECVREAISSNHALMAEAEKVEAAKAGKGMALSAFLPRVDLSETYMRSNNPVMAFGSKLNQENFTASDFALTNLNNPEPIDNFNFKVQLTQPVFNGGKQWVGLRRARLGLESADKGLERARQETAYNVTRAYCGVLLAGEYVEVAKKALETTTAHLETAQDFYDQGMMVLSEVLLAKVRLAEVQEMLVKAESRMSTAKATVNMLMGRDQEEPFTPSDRLGHERFGAELGELLRQAENSRPDLAGMELDAKNMEAAVTLAKTDYLPHVNFVARYELDDEDIFGGRGDSYTLLGMASWNVFDGLLTTNRVREASARYNSARHMQDQMLQNALLEVRSAYYELQAADKRIDAATQAVGEGEEGLRIIRRRFDSGMARTIDVLDAETALSRARANRAQALYDYNVALAGLRLATGTLIY